MKLSDAPKTVAIVTAWHELISIWVVLQNPVAFIVFQETTINWAARHLPAPFTV
jgi:hypothetical protein